jgi:hypothetical protein
MQCNLFSFEKFINSSDFIEIFDILIPVQIGLQSLALHKTIKSGFVMSTTHHNEFSMRVHELILEADIPKHMLFDIFNNIFEGEKKMLQN